MPYAAAKDGLFLPQFAKTYRDGTPWFGILVSTAVASALMGFAYSSETGLTVFTYLVGLSVVTVAIPYFFSACAQLAFLVSRRRKVVGWALTRDLAIATAGILFSLWGDVRLRLPGGLPGNAAAAHRYPDLRLPQGAPGACG
jgi:APA family basic amino acid/polyamine antiporter